MSYGKNSKTVTIPMANNLYQGVKDVSKKEMQSVSATIRQMCRDGVEEYKLKAKKAPSAYQQSGE